MICPSCHAENIEGADECATCGKPLYGLDLPDAPLGSKSPAFIRKRLADLPRRPAVHVGANDPVSLAVRLMQVQDAGCVLVMDGNKLAGIISGWDILHKVAGPREDLSATTCGQIMTAKPLFLRPEDTLAMALNAMAASGFRHIPILEDDRLDSVVDVNDVFRDIAPHIV